MDQHEFWESGGQYRQSDHPVVELFARQRVRYLERIGALADVRSVLDVGAGSGFSSAYYPTGIHVVACDYAAGMLHGNPVRDRLRCSAYQLPFRDGAFDVTTCWELLHHLDDPTAAVAEMLRVAHRQVVLFEPNRINPGHIVLGLTRDNERQCLRYTPGYVRRLVQAAGGQIARHERCGLLFPNITPERIARWLMRLPYRAPVIGISQLVIADRGG
jgi:ubiquinone/menaquinone biosynthesis C-methylase UbiE